MFKLLSVNQSEAELKLQLPEGLGGGSKNVRYYISHDAANCIFSNGSLAASLPKQDTTVDWPFWVFTFVFNYL